jgi:hypothetical protein
VRRGHVRRGLPDCFGIRFWKFIVWSEITQIALIM